MAVSIVGGLAGSVITSGGLNTFKNTGIAINQHDTLLLWCSDVESAATTTVSAAPTDTSTNTWVNAATQADAVIDGTHHGSGSLWLCKDAAAAAATGLTGTVTLTGATHNGYVLVILRGADNVNTIANSGAAVAMSTSHPGSAPNPTTFTSTSVTDNSTLDQAIAFAACWPNSGTDSGAAGTGATKVVSIAQNGGSNLCCVSLNAGSINGTNNVLGSVCNIAGVAALVLGTVVIAAAGGAPAGVWLPEPPSHKIPSVRPPRGRSMIAVPAQIPVPVMVVPNRQPEGRRMLAIRRGRLANPVLTQAAAAAPPWPPATRQPAGRRMLALRRGRQTNPVLTQAAAAPPKLAPAKLGAAVRKLGLVGRGKRTMAIAEHAPPPRQAKAPRPRLAAIARGRQWDSATMSGLSPIGPSVIYAPFSTASRQLRRIAAARRARYDPPWGQQQAPTPPTWPPPKLGAARRLLSGAQKGRRATPVPAQITVPPTIPGNRLSTARSRFSMLRRGRPFNPVLTQAPPAPPPWVQSRTTPPRRLAALVRGRRRDVTPAQVPVPKWPPRIIRSLPRWGWLRRGKRADPGWGQAVEPPPTGTPIRIVVKQLAPVDVVVRQAEPVDVVVKPLGS